MTRLRFTLVCAALAIVTAAQTPARPSSWTLVRSTLTYQVTHPLHHVEGISQAARGRGVCQAGTCNFLVAAPVKLFRSGDTDRDLHMLQATRGAQYPMVTVRTSIPAADLHPGVLHANVQVSFAGQQKDYAQLAFRITAAVNGEIELRGTIPAKLTDFKITPPELLLLPIRDDIPVQVDLLWRPDA